MSIKNNYKTKWLNALENSRGDVVAKAEDDILAAKDASRQTTDAVLALRQTKSMVNELATCCKSLVGECDGLRELGGLSFTEIGHTVDTKLSSMPIHVALRRVRDVIKIAEARIAVLSIHSEDQFIANKKYSEMIPEAINAKTRMYRALVETCYVGDRPTTSEIEDYTDKTTDYRRHDIHYEDMDHTWTDTMLMNSTILRTAERAHDDSDDDGSDIDATEVNEPNNRLARIQQMSPGYKSRSDL